jgi:hypothetical protein
VERCLASLFAEASEDKYEVDMFGSGIMERASFQVSAALQRVSTPIGLANEAALQGSDRVGLASEARSTRPNLLFVICYLSSVIARSADHYAVISCTACSFLS